MSEFHAGWQGSAHGFTHAFDHLANEVMRRRDESRKAVGLLLEAQIKNKLSTPGQGRIRQRLTRRIGKLGRRGARTNIARAGRASAPGQPPAPDTGALRNSVLYHVEAGVHIVGTDQVQAAALEFGTNAAGRGHHTRILPRPYMRPALNEIRDHIGEVIALPLRFGDKF